MSKRKWILFSVPIIIIAISISAFSYGGWKTQVEFRPWQGYVEIGPEEIPVLTFAWLSCTEGLSWDFIDTAVYNIFVYQDDVLIGQYFDAGEWGNPYVSGTAGNCLHGDGTVWRSFMTFEDLNIEDSGIYEVHTEYYLSYPVTDGFDDNGDGYLDVYSPYRYWITMVEVFE